MTNDHVPTVFFWRYRDAWQRTPDADPPGMCNTPAQAIERMGCNEPALVRAEDAATVDAWLAARGAMVQGVGA